MRLVPFSSCSVVERRSIAMQVVVYADELRVWGTGSAVACSPNVQHPNIPLSRAWGKPNPTRLEI